MSELTADSLLRELDQLPARGTTAVEVLWMVDDPKVSAGQLARVVEGDEALTTRLMRMANAPFYGLSGRVSSATFAITVLGFDTVRAVAVAAAAGVLHDSVPAQMLGDASMTAAAAAIIGPGLGCSPSEATSIGLLHNIGSMLLHRHDPAVHDRLAAQAAADGIPLHEAERARYGSDGHHLAALLLTRWWFPEPFVEAIATQRDPAGRSRSPLGATLCSAIAVTDTILRPTEDPTVQAGRDEALALGRVDDALIARVAGEGEGLHATG